MTAVVVDGGPLMLSIVDGEGNVINLNACSLVYVATANHRCDTTLDVRWN